MRLNLLLIVHAVRDAQVACRAALCATLSPRGGARSSRNYLQMNQDFHAVEYVQAQEIAANGNDKYTYAQAARHQLAPFDSRAPGEKYARLCCKSDALPIL